MFPEYYYFQHNHFLGECGHSGHVWLQFWYYNLDWELRLLNQGGSFSLGARFLSNSYKGDSHWQMVASGVSKSIYLEDLVMAPAIVLAFNMYQQSPITHWRNGKIPGNIMRALKWNVNHLISEVSEKSSHQLLWKIIIVIIIIVRCSFCNNTLLVVLYGCVSVVCSWAELG